jgi:hypothetical protein
LSSEGHTTIKINEFEEAHNYEFNSILNLEGLLALKIAKF